MNAAAQAGAMILLIHLLQHLGLPSGVALAVVIAARRLLKGARVPGRAVRSARTRDHRDRSRRHSRAYR